MVKAVAWQAKDPGSIPGPGTTTKQNVVVLRKFIADNFYM